MTPDRDRVEEIRLWMSGQTFSEPYPRWADAIVTLLQTIDELRKAGDFIKANYESVICGLGQELEAAKLELSNYKNETRGLGLYPRWLEDEIAACVRSRDGDCDVEDLCRTHLAKVQDWSAMVDAAMKEEGE